ncbi:hypothetical protein [Streptomyces tubercidicus]|uniref:hypothetical protein n=1 Tax=Streptomyces tubercidicus TaxID=47759 RepID=UPI0034675A63
MAFSQKRRLHPLSRPLRGIALSVLPLTALAAVSAPSAAHAETAISIKPSLNTGSAVGQGEITDGKMNLRFKPLNPGDGDQNFLEEGASTDAARKAGAVTLVHKNTGMCLTQTKEAREGVWLEKCAEGNEGQNWEVLPAPDGAKQLRLFGILGGDKCLTQQTDKLAVTDICATADTAVDNWNFQKFILN